MSTGKKARRELDDLVDQYANSEKSDTFVSYNNAITLAREVRRLRKVEARLKAQLAQLEQRAGWD